MATESISLKHLSFANLTKNPSPSCRFHPRRTSPCRTLRFRFGVTCSKTSEFQDFRSYAMPLRLLPAEEARVCGGNPSLSKSGSRSFYKVKLQTSNTSGSGLSDVSARILLCLIDEKGDSVLQTIPANLSRNESLGLEDARRNGESLAFQRGSVDEIAFEGPELGKIRALWISTESGQWRVGGVSLWVVHPHGEAGAETFGYRYDFEVDEILLGESSDLSMVELRPFSVTKLTGSDPLKDQTLPSSSTLLRPTVTKEQSMEEYTDLKLSLLLYDASLVLLGTTAFSFSPGEESSGIAFFTGGITGFLYLLLLQRSVDKLPVPESSSPESSNRNPLGRLKIPALSLALAVGFSVLAAVGSEVTEREILVGTMGFLVCRVAVVLAAFKPFPFGLKSDK